MSLKTKVQNLARRIHRFSKGSHHSSRSSGSSRRAYRTEYQRYLWGGGFLIVFFLMVIFAINGDSEGSIDNNGIIILVLFAMAFACLGAYLAPGLTGIASRYTAHGRRKAATRALPRFRSYKQSSSQHFTHSSHSSMNEADGISDGGQYNTVKAIDSHSTQSQ